MELLLVLGLVALEALLLEPPPPQSEKRDVVDDGVVVVGEGDARSSDRLEIVLERPPDVDVEIEGDKGDGGMYVYVWFAARKWRHLSRPPSASELRASGRSLKRGGVGLVEASEGLITERIARPMKEGRLNSRTLIPWEGEVGFVGAPFGAAPLFIVPKMLSPSASELESEKAEGVGTGSMSEWSVTTNFMPDSLLRAAMSISV